MKTEKELNSIGKFMSLILRHKPEEANITLDKEGWADVNTLLKSINISLQELDWIVENNNKKRFGYNDSKTKIRANQGHSIDEVEIDFEEVIDAPEFLYHGTSTDTFPLLLKDGIKKMTRKNVHLSKDEETAINVGKRKSSNIVIVKVKAKDFVNGGNKLFISKNGVYLAEFIHAKYVDVTPIYIT